MSQFLNRKFHHESTFLLFKKSLFLWCLINITIMSFDHSMFWGENSFIPPISDISLDRGIYALDILSHPAVAPFYPIFLILYSILLLNGILRGGSRWNTLGIWFLNTALMFRCHFVFDGGDRLAMHMLLYCALIDLFAISKADWTAISFALRNVLFQFLRIQLCVVYAAASLSKLSGDLWPAGEALYYVMQTDEYSVPFIQQLAIPNEIIALATYAVLGYQLSFPILIWWKKSRPWVVLVGTGLHLGIALGMGIFSFGTLLCICYMVFNSEEKSQRWLQRFATIFERNPDPSGKPISTPG